MCGRGQVETLTLDLATGPDGGVAARAVTRYGYDAWANPTRVVYPAAGNGRHHAITNTYDPATGTAVVASTEYDLTPDQVTAFLDHGTLPTDPASLGTSASAVYDPRLQVITARTDANGHTTRHSYDALGRLTQTTLPSGPGTGVAAGGSVIDYHYAPRGTGINTGSTGITGRPAPPPRRTRRPSTTSAATC